MYPLQYISGLYVFNKDFTVIWNEEYDWKLATSMFLRFQITTTLIHLKILLPQIDLLLRAKNLKLLIHTEKNLLRAYMT